MVKEPLSNKRESKRQNDFFDTCGQCKVGFLCCHDTKPPITRKRREIVETYLRASQIPIENPFVGTEYVSPRTRSDGYCVFHEKNTRRCLIHSVKPETCVAGPITFDINVQKKKIEWFVKMEKTCPLARVVYENKGLLQEHLESAKKEILRLVRELDPKALKAILGKEEPETFKIDEDTLESDILDKLR